LFPDITDISLRKTIGWKYMESLFVLALAVIFCLAVVIRELYSARTAKKKFIASLYSDYGNIPDREYSLERFARMDSYYRRHRKEGQIDDITWNDLNMDDVFKRINTTLSASGEEYLYYKLRTISDSDEEMNHFERVTEYFSDNADERVQVQYLMSRLGHTEKYSLYDYLENLDGLGKRSNIKHIALDVLYIFFIGIIPFKLSLGVLLTAVLMVYNIISYFKEKNEIDPYIVSFAYVVRLLDTVEELKGMEISGLDKERDIFSKGLDRLGMIRRNSWFILSGNKYISSSNPLEILSDYIKMTLHIDLIQFNRMLNKIKSDYDEIDALIEAVGFIETAICVGAFRKSLSDGWCIPRTDAADNLKIEECYHPLLTNAVKNSVETKINKGILITGSNASGKSTFLRTIALNILLAQSINTCSADSYSAPDSLLFSSMSIKDDIRTGESYYMAEIRSIKRILDASANSGMHVVCFVDEVLRGTNTVERIAASTEILKSLAGGNVTCFAATHDIELTMLLEKYYDNYHFEEEISNGDVHFPYKLISGRAVSANAIRLLDIMGYDEKITERARHRAERFTCTGKWDVLD